MTWLCSDLCMLVLHHESITSQTRSAIVRPKQSEGRKKMEEAQDALCIGTLMPLSVNLRRQRTLIKIMSQWYPFISSWKYGLKLVVHESTEPSAKTEILGRMRSSKVRNCSRLLYWLLSTSKWSRSFHFAFNSIWLNALNSGRCLCIAMKVNDHISRGPFRTSSKERRKSNSTAIGAATDYSWTLLVYCQSSVRNIRPSRLHGWETNLQVATACHLSLWSSLAAFLFHFNTQRAIKKTRQTGYAIPQTSPPIRLLRDITSTFTGTAWNSWSLANGSGLQSLVRFGRGNFLISDLFNLEKTFRKESRAWNTVRLPLHYHWYHARVRWPPVKQILIPSHEQQSEQRRSSIGWTSEFNGPN